MHHTLQCRGLQGKKRAVVLALDIMCDAVDRYKELCEGRYCGEHPKCAIMFCCTHPELVVSSLTYSLVMHLTNPPCATPI